MSAFIHEADDIQLCFHHIKYEWSLNRNIIVSGVIWASHWGITQAQDSGQPERSVFPPLVQCQNYKRRLVCIHSNVCILRYPTNIFLRPYEHNLDLTLVLQDYNPFAFNQVIPDLSGIWVILRSVVYLQNSLNTSGLFLASFYSCCQCLAYDFVRETTFVLTVKFL